MKALRLAGGALAILGILFLLANHTVLAERHCAVTRKLDEEGNVVLDTSGRPILIVNPACQDFKKRQNQRSILGFVMVVAGILALRIGTSGPGRDER